MTNIEQTEDERLEWIKGQEISSTSDLVEALQKLIGKSEIATEDKKKVKAKGEI